MSTIKKDNKSIKVKVFYTLRGSKSTRLTTFTINDEENDLSIKPISLKTCLWSICSSSPDMICRDHDLSIYTANFHESGLGPSKKRDSLIWEGHGLLSWIMDQSKQEIQIYGKPIDDTSIDIYIELQPTMKWIKDDYFNALRNKSFEQFKSSIQTPLHPICNCYSTDEAAYPSRQIASPPSSSNHKETEFDRYLRQRVQPDTNSSPPTPSRVASANVPVFRPEPIFPTSTNTTINNNNNNNEYNKRTPPPPPFYKQQQQQQQEVHHGDLTLPVPSSMAYTPQPQPLPQPPKKDIRRSAFTIASLSESKEHQQQNIQQQQHQQQQQRYLPPSTSNSSTSSSSSPPSNYKLDDNHIPVIYTPSNKKRKKNPIIMPAASSSTTTTTTTTTTTPSAASTIENHASGSRTMYQKPTSQQQLPPQQQHIQQQQQQQQQNMQQVNTVVRTYYEVDRDNQGAYILPVEIDSWTVVDLGTVIYERPAYHNQRYIYPANYTVRKWYRSMVDPKSDTQYTCRILENGREPKFEVTADDCPMTYSGPTPTTVWTIIVRRAFAIRNQEYGHNPVGPDFFGLRKNTIAKMIQDLPNASKCSQYVWQTFEPARFNKPGRNRRRADSTLPGSLLGGVNYGLTSSRLIHNTNLTSTQHSYRANSSQSSPSSPTNEDESNTPHNHRPSIVETA